MSYLEHWNASGMSCPDTWDGIPSGVLWDIPLRPESLPKSVMQDTDLLVTQQAEMNSNNIGVAYALSSKEI